MTTTEKPKRGRPRGSVAGTSKYGYEKLAQPHTHIDVQLAPNQPAATLRATLMNGIKSWARTRAWEGAKFGTLSYPASGFVRLYRAR